MANEKKKASKPAEDTLGYWAVILERADEEGDWERAAEAQRNLKRLRWNVSREPQEVGT